MERTPSGQYSLTPLWVSSHPRLNATAVRLYDVLYARFADYTTHLCHPSRKAIAESVGVSFDTVDRAVKQLEQVGAIVVTRSRSPEQGHVPNEYMLMVEPPEALGRSLNLPPKRSAASRDDAASPSRTLAASPSRKDAALFRELRQSTEKKSRKEKPLTNEQRVLLHTRYDIHFSGGATEVDEMIAEALNHDAARKNADMHLYVNGWLRRNAKRETNGSSNGQALLAGGMKYTVAAPKPSGRRVE